jgi:TolB-like protein
LRIAVWTGGTRDTRPGADFNLASFWCHLGYNRLPERWVTVLRYLFEGYALDTDRRELRRGDDLVPIEPQVFDLLSYLVSQRDRVVSKDDLLTAVWKGRIVSESALTTRINAVRAALGDSGEAQRLLRTLRNRGFRFVGDVRASHEASANSALNGSPALALPDRPSLAVLPFTNMSGDPEQEYFADGMVDDILTGLSRVRWLFVIARHSSFCYKGRTVDVRQIGRELGVRYVIEGSVRKSGTRVRITAQLIDAEADAHIWADRYDGDLRDIFALQDELAMRIVAAVETNVQAAEIKRTWAKPTDSLTAYDLYLRALPAYFGQTRGDYDRAEVLLGKAVQVDPEYAEALGILTDSTANRAVQGWHESWTRGAEEACQLADRALAAGPDNSTCLANAAFAYGVVAYRFEEGLDLANRALMLHPNSVLVRNRAAAVHVVCGEGHCPMRGGPPHEPARQQESGHHHLRNPLVRALLCAPLRGVHPCREARVGIHSDGECSPQICCHIPCPTWPHRRGAGRDRRASQISA